jgi:hypothetical protein
MSNRRILPQRRANNTFEFEHRNHKVSVTVGYYPDGAVGEVFVSSQHIGSNLDAVARDGAVLLSIALQHHVPLKTISHALTREADGSASTVIGAVVDRLTEEYTR